MSIKTKSYYKFLAGSISAAFVATAVVPVVASTDSFSDVSAEHWANNYITELANEGIINGFTDGTFGPNVELTRGQASKLFQRALNLEVPEDLTSFNDVEDSTDLELKKAAAAVKAAGIFKGSNGIFGANDTLTRAQMASVIVRAFGLEVNDEIEITLTDIENIDDSHRANVAILFQNGVTTGKGDGTYDGNGNVPRANFAAFLYRALNQEAGLVTEDEDPPIEEPQPQSQVVSVIADNLKKIEILFNEDINEGSLTTSTVKILDETNKELKVMDTTIINGDKVAVILESGELKASEDVTVVLDRIKTVDNNNIEYEQVITVRDVNTPELLDVKVLNDKQIELYFSEPVSFSQSSYNTLSEITIDDQNVTAKVTPDHATNTVTLELFESLNTRKFELNISGIEDFNNSKITPQTIDIEVEDDVSIPGEDDTQNPGDEDSEDEITAFVDEVFSLVNIEREEEGVDPLILSNEVTEVAQIKAEDMRDQNYFDHISPTYGEPGEMLLHFGVNYNMSGENIAAGQTTPEQVVEAWMNSEGHRKNILRPEFTEIGIGYIEGSEHNNYSTYWVQMFVLPAN
ncbi:S-layer homology domain-containing protein [Bacillus sp. SM2101]|uniref:S-layer homology domain-containing protein n=1 Tax=Bacillus sp. SM2101 TaxID=2805366 RepID=UPI001BDF5FE3|nr:S-layer homology domain-containing protein [Bacillus sp. SM2101]